MKARSLLAGAALALVSTSMTPAGPREAIGSNRADFRNGSVYANVTPAEIVLGNGLAERRWDRSSFATTVLRDKRAGGMETTRSADFTLDLGATSISSEVFRVEEARVTLVRKGLRVAMRLGGPGIEVTRTVEAYNGIAGFRAETLVEPVAPVALRGATLDQAALTEPVTTTLHAFRAGADWRDPSWEGPPLQVGDAHEGTWRDSRSARPGEDIEGPAQWLSARTGDRSLFMVMERNDWPSSRASQRAGIARLEIDHSRDVVVLGPFEESAHVENPSDAPGRARVIAPGASLSLPPTFVGFGHRDGDEAWQFHKYLSDHRLPRYGKDVTFNSNGIDSNRISTGAKDDMDFETVQRAAPLMKRLGVDTFILDDGWQAISGDWYPDCPDHPEPRWDGTPESKFRPRFPDCDFEAVRKAIAPMELGLWMSPMHFNPASETYRRHPEWACTPVGHALAAVNTLDPDSGSNEAGIGTWGPDAIPHVESRIRTAIRGWKVEYFKFDFLVWLDCVGQGDMYDYHDAFVAMLDRLQAAHPGVTFQIDETNDYRLFPFESVTRGPSWFQNGTPEPRRLLHNLWNLSPFVPTSSIGQHFLGGRQWSSYSVDTLMAVALPSHLTFFSNPLEVPVEVYDAARPWVDFYKDHRELLTGVTYPLVADPLEKGWTALQTWDPERARGMLFVYRQRASNATQTVALENVPEGMTFDLFEAPGGEHLTTVTSRDLSEGIEVTIALPDGARVLAIRPAPPAPSPSG